MHRRGDLPYGSREYLLLPIGLELIDFASNAELRSATLASLRAHRNILFAAEAQGGDLYMCRCLVQAALEDAGAHGEQPQALARLDGLCAWVIENMDAKAPTIASLDETSRLAVEALATGEPRPGHSVVGQGTFRDGAKAWEALAKDYVKSGYCREGELYQSVGGQLVGIELQADMRPDYVQTAAGAMARFFFF